MKWINHKLLTFSLVFLATDNPLYAFCSIPGSVFPDWVEGKPPSMGGSYGWQKRHRGFSHWFVPYLLLFYLVYYLKKNGFHFWGFPLLYDMVFFFFVGIFAHIFEDFFCGRIPVFSPSSRFGIRFFRVGSFLEYFFVFFVLLIASYFKYY